MATISFPVTRTERSNPSHSKNSSSRKSKEDLLIKIVKDNIWTIKTKTELDSFCKNELRVISIIIDARGNLSAARSNLDKFKSENPEYFKDNVDDHIEELICLFTNRNSGWLGQQNITRTAAKYIEVLLQCYGQNNLGELQDYEKNNIILARSESNKWYRMNYIHKIDIHLSNHCIFHRLYSRCLDVDDVLSMSKNFSAKLALGLFDSQVAIPVIERFVKCHTKGSNNLDLSKLFLEVVPKYILKELPLIQELNLSANRISHIGNDFKDCTKLKCINLRNNIVDVSIAPGAFNNNILLETVHLPKKKYTKVSLESIFDNGIFHDILNSNDLNRHICYVSSGDEIKIKIDKTALIASYITVGTPYESISRKYCLELFKLNQLPRGTALNKMLSEINEGVIDFDSLPKTIPWEKYKNIGNYPFLNNIAAPNLEFRV